jgi:hypothetical protein
MKKCLAFCMWMAFLAIACEGRSLAPQGKSEAPPVPKAVVEMEKVEGEAPLPPEVKIKLRRDGKDNYSWEISGSDVNQILKVNEKLRKHLAGEQPR